MLGAMLGGSPESICVPEANFIADTAHSVPRSDWLTIAPDEVVRRTASSEKFGLWGIDPAAWLERARGRGPGLRNAFEALVSLYGEQHGKHAAKSWVDHTPSNSWKFWMLMRLFPDAVLLHLVRDGRAVAASVMPLDWGMNEAHRAAEWWVHRVTQGLATEALWPDRVRRIRYEDVVRDPESCLRRLSEFAGLRYSEAMLCTSGFEVPRYSQNQHALVGNAPNAARISAWRTQLTARQVEIIEALAEPVLVALGYELQSAAPVTVPRGLELAVLELRHRIKLHVVNRIRYRRRRALLANRGRT